MTVSERLAADFPPPLDWQDFQRKCVFLFRLDLSDPHAMEYGRGGQKQRGIDILAKRDGDPNKYVGVQCRRVAKPLTEAKILADCKAALAIEASLTEIIFATTAKDDTNATDAAVAVEKQLRADGHQVIVALYGWSALRARIALHDAAFAIFFPSAAAGVPAQVPLSNEDELFEKLAARFMRTASAPVSATSAAAAVAISPDDMKAEDPALHAKIDVFADLIKDDQVRTAETGLRRLLDGDALTDKPWARYRVVANLGTAALMLGRDDEGAGLYEEAHALRPDFPKAIALLSTARTVQGRYEEAMQLAEQALNATPAADHIVSHLLQAAARSNWQGDPESLVPSRLKGTADADVGLAEFLRRRETPGWERRVLALASRHPNVDALQHNAAVATLTLALGKDDIIGMGGDASLTPMEISNAATHLKKYADHLLTVRYADRSDLTAYVNNAAILLRIANRDAEAIDLLERVAPSPSEPQLIRLYALALASVNRRTDAIAALNKIPTDIEAVLLGAEMNAAGGDIASAIAGLTALDVGNDNKLRRIRLRIIGELAVQAEDSSLLLSTAQQLRDIESSDPIAPIFDAHRARICGASDDEVHSIANEALVKLNDKSDVPTRYAAAEGLLQIGLPDAAAKALEGHVDLSRNGAAGFMYLQALAAARQDEAFAQALKSASPSLREDTAVRRLVAEHSWNVGDLTACEGVVKEVLASAAPPSWARLLMLEILVRQDRSAELVDALSYPIEDQAWPRVTDLYRVASLLAYFGYSERGAALAYRTWLNNRGDARAWTTLSNVVLREGFDASKDRLWMMSVVGDNAGVDLEYDDKSTNFFVIEPNETLRNLDAESIEPNHPIAQATMGLRVADDFVGPDGRLGKIANVRHKYVARLHYVMAELEGRFPSISGTFKSIRIDPDAPDALADLKVQLKQQSDWVRTQRDLWLNNSWPLALLAQRTGTDEIDLSAGLVAEGVKLRVADGNQQERDRASAAVRLNRDGCVLDLLSYWTAWRLKALDAIRKTCGPIHVSQSLVDALRRRRERLVFNARSGALKLGTYDDGQFAIHEISADVIDAQAADVLAAIEWLQDHVSICPIVITNTLAPQLGDIVRSGATRMFDPIALAHERQLLLVSDDKALRELALVGQNVRGAWSDVVFRVALNRSDIDISTYTRWNADLIDAGHAYIGASGFSIAEALRIDAANQRQVPGHYFRTVVGTLGGAGAEPTSHIRAAVEALSAIWNDASLIEIREAATGVLFRELFKQRRDYQSMLMQTYRALNDEIPCRDYLIDWAHGHFLLKRSSDAGPRSP